MPLNISQFSSRDSQIIEFVSRNILIKKLFDNGFETAIPIRDCGVDLLVYSKTKSHTVRKIQLKSSLGQSFSFHDKYLAIQDLYFIFIMNLSFTRTNGSQTIYGMSLEEIQKIISEFKINPNKKGHFYRKNISKEFIARISQFEISNDAKFRKFFI